MALGDKLIPRDILKELPVPRKVAPWEWLCTGTIHHGNTPCDHRVIQFGHTDKDGNYSCKFCGMKIMRTGSPLKDKLDMNVKNNIGRDSILMQKLRGKKIGIKRL